MRVDKCWWLLIFSVSGWIWPNADVYWYVGWVNKSPKICWSNKRMVPYPEVHWEQINGSLVMELLRVKLLVWQGQLRLRLVCRCIPLRSQTWSLSTPDANTMGVTSAHCQLQFSGRPSRREISTRFIKSLVNFLFVYFFVCCRILCKVKRGVYQLLMPTQWG